MIYEFAATQDLHGYDKPWAPGAGANIWDEEVESGYINPSTGAEEASTTKIRMKNYVPVSPETTYYKKCGKNIDGTAQQFWNVYYDSDKQYISYGNPDSGTFTTPADCAYIRCGFEAGYGTTYKHDIAINYPATVTTYSPYANVCMPEGFNIWDPTTQEYVQVYAGYVNSNTRELYLRPVYQEYAGEELVGPWMSSLDPYSEDATPTEGSFVIDFGGELTSFEITPFMLQTLLDSLGIRQHFTDGAGLLNSLMDQAQGRVRSEEELLHLSRPLKVIAIGDQLPPGITIKLISKDILPGLPGKFIR